MTADWPGIYSTIAAMFLVMLVGWAARRTNYFPDLAVTVMGRFVVDIAFPALTFAQMLRTVNSDTLRHSGPFFLSAVAILSLAFIIAYAASFAAGGGHRPSFVFIAAMPNWIFLPLAVVPSILGDSGTKIVLLFNIPAQVFLWTLGIWVLRGGFKGSHSIRHIITNPGLLATFAGIVAAVAWPSLQTHENSAPLRALNNLGAMTVPLSLVVTGAQLGSVKLRAGISVRLVIAMAVRLLIAPIVTFVLVSRIGLLPVEMKTVLCIISAMPVAVSSALLIERFGGDRELAATATTASTVLNLATLPAMIWLMSHALK